MTIESRLIPVSRSQEDLYAFVSEVKNFKEIMPQDIQKFEADADSFLFALKGMPEIKLRILEQNAPGQLVLAAASQKIPVKLSVDINKVDSDSSEVQLIFEGSFNPMLKMMVERPLKNFLGVLADNIEKL